LIEVPPLRTAEAERRTTVKKPNNVSVLQPQGQLAELAQRIRAERAAVAKAHSDLALHAIAYGRALIEAKAAVKHGEWVYWLTHNCEVGEREARRYMEVAREFDQNGHSASGLTGLSLRGLKQLLVPAKEHLSKPTGQTGHTVSVSTAKPKRATHCDLLGLWAYMPAEERRAFFDGIGPRAIIDGIPDAWLGEVIEQLIERERPHKLQPKKVSRKKLAIPGDLSIPEFLKVAAPANGEAANALAP
jgi:hypothetical protein